MTGNPAKIWLSNHREENSFTKIPIVHADRWFSPPCFPLPPDQAAFEASLFFERSSCIRQPSSETRQKLCEPPIHRGFGHLSGLFCTSKRNQKELRSSLLTFVLIGDRSPSILAESSCQLPSPPSYSLCPQPLSIPHEKSHARSCWSLPSPRWWQGTATLSNLNPQCLGKSPVPGEACSFPHPLPSLFLSLPRSLSPPSLSSLSLSIICLQLSVSQPHLTNDSCLRYCI